MNRMIKLATVSAMALWAATASAKEVTQDFKVDGWNCQSCADKTVTEVRKVNGVKEAKADSKALTLTVTYDDEVIKGDAVAEAVKKAGYSCSIKDQKKG
jgi:copper chaperone CopZ